jgi:putative ABC transport system permease protein
VTGTLPESGHRIAVSHRLAKLLRLDVGSRLLLQVRTHRGAINALDLEVAGLVSTGNQVVDAFGIWVPRSLATELIASDLPSHIAVELSHREDAPAFAEELRTALGEQADVVTWQDETRDMLSIQEVRRRSLDLVMFILMALAGFGIANTILMAAYERIREIGTLRSMGMSESGVVWLFLVEGLLIGFIGSLLGALWGGGLVAHWATHPLDFSESFEKAGQGYSLSALVYTHFDARIVLATIAVGVLVAMIASIYPARVASRMSPADAVRA